MKLCWTTTVMMMIGAGDGGEFDLRVACTPHGRRFFRLRPWLVAALAESLFLCCSLVVVAVAGCIVSSIVVVLMPLSEGT